MPLILQSMYYLETTGLANTTSGRQTCVLAASWHRVCAWIYYRSTPRGDFTAPRPQRLAPNVQPCRCQRAALSLPLESLEPLSCPGFAVAWALSCCSHNLWPHHARGLTTFAASQHCRLATLAAALDWQQPHNTRGPTPTQPSLRHSSSSAHGEPACIYMLPGRAFMRGLAHSF